MWSWFVYVSKKKACEQYITALTVAILEWWDDMVFFYFKNEHLLLFKLEK